MVTEKDMQSGEVFDDTVAVFPAGGRGEDNLYAYMPYRCLVPRKVDGLLVACRAFSSDGVVNTRYNLIPHCIVFGEAAGTAAALAAKEGIEPRKVNYGALQDRLLKQGILLPGIESAKARV